jgi:glycosyltransferase involved in cell wall biosynthesis
MRLTLAGPDWKGGRSWLENRATELCIDNRVEFKGALTGGQVGDVLAAADVYVQLSRHEGFGLSVAEALLAGKPAVLSNAIGTISYPEIAALPHIKVVQPAKDAAAEAMIEAVQMLPALRSAACRSESVLADFFSWPRIARLHLDQYMQLLRSGTTDRSPERGGQSETLRCNTASYASRS